MIMGIFSLTSMITHGLVFCVGLWLGYKAGLWTAKE